MFPKRFTCLRLEFCVHEKTDVVCGWGCLKHLWINQLFIKT